MKNNNFIAGEMNKLLSNPSFGFNKAAKPCCKACGPNCKCDEDCNCQGQCDEECSSCTSMDKKSYVEMFQLILTASDKLDSLGFDRAATLLIKASDHLMQEVSDANMADEGSKELNSKAKKIFQAVVMQKENNKDSNDLDFFPDLEGGSLEDTSLQSRLNEERGEAEEDDEALDSLIEDVAADFEEQPDSEEQPDFEDEDEL